MLHRASLVLAISVLVSGAAAAATGAGVPRLDVSRTCRDAFDALQTGGVSSGAKKASRAKVQQAYKSCMDSENSARASAVQRWTRVKGEDRRTCAGMAGALFPSYVELDACLQMYDEKDPQLTGAAASAPLHKR